MVTVVTVGTQLTALPKFLAKDWKPHLLDAGVFEGCQCGLCVWMRAGNEREEAAMEHGGSIKRKMDGAVASRCGIRCSPVSLNSFGQFEKMKNWMKQGI